MLFHITMTHTPENCPAYWPADEQQKMFAQAEKMQDAAKEMNVKIHFMVGGIGHKMYGLIEADSFNAINMFFSGVTLKQDYQIEPVGHFQDIIVSFKAELGNK